MFVKTAVFFVILIIFKAGFLSASESPRQKRCIVVQKQSGGRDVGSEEDDNDDYTMPQPKDPRPDRLVANRPSKFDVEGLSPMGLLKTVQPAWKKNKMALRHRLLNRRLYN
ncbi:hypothetical protein evm_010854 [Chilo suppressalis]|nr:hypothetical protein evm_010854 [Chilo suppressalis]